MTRHFQLTALAAATALLLAACGGSSSSGGGTAPPPSGSETGVLTDAPIQGVAYLTSSGVSGTTDADGHYDYNPGDTVTFSLGDLEIGTVTATGVVTPIDLAGTDNEDRLANLLVLLQALDGDSNPDNGINIPAAAAAAVSADIDLDADPAVFASAANTDLQAAMTAGGISGGIPSVEDAQAHFLAQGLALLASNIWVTYDNDTAALIRFTAEGDYLLGEAMPDDYSGYDCEEAPPFNCVPSEDADLISKAGVELGTATPTGVDTYGYILEASTTIDNNEQGGLSHPLSCDRFKPEGDELVVGGACPDADTIARAPNSAGGFVGVWALGTATSVNTQHFALLPNGRYLMVDPLGDTETGPEDPSCGGPGVEYATYTLGEPVDGWRALNIGTVLYDTNGCAGLIDDSTVEDTFQVRIAADGTLRLRVEGSTGAETLYRVSQ